MIAAVSVHVALTLHDVVGYQWCGALLKIAPQVGLMKCLHGSH